MKKVIFVIYQLVLFSICNAQIVLEDPSLTKNFISEVKSLDEFAARFNGVESHPEITNDSLANLRNLTFLFDREKIIKSHNRYDFTILAKSFCDTILSKDIKFSLLDSCVYAVANCEIKFEGLSRQIKLILRQELTPENYVRWSLTSVVGLLKAGIIKTDKLYRISPVEHEIHFMGLSDILNNNTPKAFGYRNKEHQINQLDVFLTLIQSGLITFENIDNLTFYCLSIPGFIFSIEEIIRDSENSGWLISELIPASSEDKIKFINNLTSEK